MQSHTSGGTFCFECDNILSMDSRDGECIYHCQVNRGCQRAPRRVRVMRAWNRSRHLWTRMSRLARLLDAYFLIVLCRGQCLLPFALCTAFKLHRWCTFGTWRWTCFINIALPFLKMCSLHPFSVAGCSVSVIRFVRLLTQKLLGRLNSRLLTPRSCSPAQEEAAYYFSRARMSKFNAYLLLAMGAIAGLIVLRTK